MRVRGVSDKSQTIFAENNVIFLSKMYVFVAAHHKYALLA